MPRMKSGTSRVPALLFAAAVVLVSGRAGAFERQWHVGAKAGFATLAGKDLGPALDLHGAYGVSDMFDVMVEVTASRQGGKPGTDVLSASAGLSYKIDIFEWIPYVAVLGGYYRYSGSPGPYGGSGDPGASVHLGIDYLALRELAFGADLGWHASFHDGFNWPYFTVLGGAEYRWGW